MYDFLFHIEDEKFEEKEYFPNQVKTDEEIESLTLDENLTMTQKFNLILERGINEQKQALISNLSQILIESDGHIVFDNLLKKLTTYDENYLVEVAKEICFAFEQNLIQKVSHAALINVCEQVFLHGWNSNAQEE